VDYCEINDDSKIDCHTIRQILYLTAYSRKGRSRMWISRMWPQAYRI